MDASRALESGHAAAQSGDAAGANRYADEAISDADIYLRNNAYGLEAAEAFYLLGRGYELRFSTGPVERSGNLAQARDDYQLALGRNPSDSLEGDIRSQLSNVDFFQDDFAGAIDQATRAMKLVDSNAVKSSLLLRIAICQQRLAEWTSADQTFNQVIQRYPGTPVAEAAREHMGQRQFYIQLATFNTPDDADKGLMRLAATGMIITRRSDANGRTVTDTGPYESYQEAKKAKDQLGGAFPQALIVP